MMNLILWFFSRQKNLKKILYLLLVPLQIKMSFFKVIHINYNLNNYILITFFDPLLITFSYDVPIPIQHLF